MARDFAYGFYQSRLWRAVRREVLRRDHYTCRDCYGRGEEIHHIIPLDPTNINDYSVALNPDNLVSLCWRCHQKITRGLTGDVGAEYAFGEDGQIVRL